MQMRFLTPISDFYSHQPGPIQTPISTVDNSLVPGVRRDRLLGQRLSDDGDAVVGDAAGHVGAAGRDGKR